MWYVIESHVLGGDTTATAARSVNWALSPARHTSSAGVLGLMASATAVVLSARGHAGGAALGSSPGSAAYQQSNHPGTRHLGSGEVVERAEPLGAGHEHHAPEDRPAENRHPPAPQPTPSTRTNVPSISTGNRASNVAAV